MNAWNNENYQVGMGAMMQQQIAMDNPPPRHPQPAVPLIGPVIPENVVMASRNESVEADSQADVSSSQAQRTQNPRERRDRERNATDRNRRRSRSRDRRDRNDRQDRSRRDRRSRERRTKWSDDRDPVAMGAQHGPPGMPMMMPGMMPFMNMMAPQANLMAPQPMEGQIPMIPQMNIMPNMMTMPNVMDQNMMMLNQQMMPMVPNQQICTSGGIFLPPLPGVSTPSRRDRPKGCRTIFVGGLPHNITEETLHEIFQRFGSVLEIKIPRRGVFYIRFERQESVEQSFSISGYRFRFHDQGDNEATTMFIDYAMNRDDQNEHDRSANKRDTTPQRVEPFTPSALALVSDKIKSEDEFVNVASTLASWLERGECNKKNANTFYSLIQASNNQIRRLFSDKMQLDEELLNMKTSIKEKFALVLKQFEQVAKILSAAKHQRVSDHFTKQQRRNIDMWMKMTEELENMKEEFNMAFDEEETERPNHNKNVVAFEKYEELKRENENLTYELEGYKNEAYLAKDEAERKFETFKAHFIAQQALQNKHPYPGLMTSIKQKNETVTSLSEMWPKPPPPLPPPPPIPGPSSMDDNKVVTSGPFVPPSEAKLISMLTAFLMVHPLGASVDYLVSYVKSMTPSVTQATVLATLDKYKDVFICKTTGVGANIEHRWRFITFEVIKAEL